jgi:RimJ/RimL family protein N-acetyltransferase
MDPQTYAFPEVLQSPRLDIRLVRLEDAAAINAAIVESFAELHEWMPWAATVPSVADTEKHAIETQTHYAERKSYGLQVNLRVDGTLIAMTGFHDVDWSVPKLEIGYWLRTAYVGRGYMTEVVNCLTDFVFTVWQLNRVQIKMDNTNLRSWRVAERAGYKLEGILRNDTRTPAGELRDTRVYAKIRRPDGVIE